MWEKKIISTWIQAYVSVLEPSRENISKFVVASHFHDSNALLEKSTFLKLENKVCMCGVVA